MSLQAFDVFATCRNNLMNAKRKRKSEWLPNFSLTSRTDLIDDRKDISNSVCTVYGTVCTVCTVCADRTVCTVYTLCTVCTMFIVRSTVCIQIIRSVQCVQYVEYMCSMHVRMYVCTYVCMYVGT